MLDEASPQPAPTFRTLVHRLAAALARQVSPGDLAALRRLSPDDLTAPAFWKLAASMLSDELSSGEQRFELEGRWAVILSALAITAGMHDARRPFGAALAEAGYSELRFTRLLRAHGDALPSEVRSAARFLSSKAIPFDPADLAQLVLSDGAPHEESIRRATARHYFRQASLADR
ncbi:MAG: type I-E CRISPR-associated protein Cse2/CasB [Anaeromyxobacter sp.]